MSINAEVPVPASTNEALALAGQLDLYWIGERLLTLMIPAAILFSGFAGRLQNLCAKVASGRRFPTIALFGCAYLTSTFLLNLPFNYFRYFRLPHSVGVSDQSLAGWIVSQFLVLLAEMIVAALFLWIPCRIIGKMPRTWWLWSSAALVPVAGLIIFVKPILFDPLTHKYVPLEAGPEREQIEEVLGRCGLKNLPIYVGGDDTTVVGLGATNRIVLEEGLFENETPAQIRFTIGHELKHYVLGDNWKALAIIAALLLTGFGAAHAFGRSALSRWHRRFGFESLDQPAALPLFVLVFMLLWTVITPLFKTLNQHIEREADRFALELTHENDAAATLFLSWVEKNPNTVIVSPGRFQHVFRDSHPSIAERITLANTYRPWATGEALEYASDCVPY